MRLSLWLLANICAMADSALLAGGISRHRYRQQGRLNDRCGEQQKCRKTPALLQNKATKTRKHCTLSATTIEKRPRSIPTINPVLHVEAAIATEVRDRGPWRAAAAAPCCRRGWGGLGWRQRRVNEEVAVALARHLFRIIPMLLHLIPACLRRGAHKRVGVAVLHHLNTCVSGVGHKKEWVLATTSHAYQNNERAE
eukprot:1151673-Pelagomonas_calceolata.AAC.7